MQNYMFTPLDKMNIFHCEFEFYRTRHTCSHVLTSTKAWKSSIAELQSLNLVLYNMSHHLILNEIIVIMIIGSLIGKQYNRRSDDTIG